MRLIDADALFRKVKTECNPYGKPTIGFEDGNRVMNWIKQAPTVSGWVSVKDRLPPNDSTKVLTYGDPVTHWMPLPEPPKEAQDGKGC